MQTMSCSYLVKKSFGRRCGSEATGANSMAPRKVIPETMKMPSASQTLNHALKEINTTKEANQLEEEAPCHRALKPHLSFSIWQQKPASILKYIHSSQQVSKTTICSHRHKLSAIFGGQFYNSEVNTEPWRS